MVDAFPHHSGLGFILCGSRRLHPIRSVVFNLKGLHPSVVLKYKLFLPETCTDSVYKTELYDFHMISL